mmetsp:Transcript_11038/g.27915  ORF Transcript_11038/g.27915 Transcript_11038/m.27915 type:complete len:252 (-) Transcript_11038:736-1491(-)
MKRQGPAGLRFPAPPRSPRSAIGSSGEHFDLDLRHGWKPVSDGSLNAFGQRWGALVLDGASVVAFHRLDEDLAAVALDRGAEHVQVAVDGLRRDVARASRPGRRRVADANDFLHEPTKVVPEGPLQAHGHGRRRRRARSAGPFQLQLHHPALHRHHLHVASVRDQIGSNLVQYQVHRVDVHHQGGAPGSATAAMAAAGAPRPRRGLRLGVSRREGAPRHDPLSLALCRRRLRLVLTLLLLTCLLLLAAIPL